MMAPFTTGPILNYGCSVFIFTMIKQHRVLLRFVWCRRESKLISMKTFSKVNKLQNEVGFLYKLK